MDDYEKAQEVEEFARIRFVKLCVSGFGEGEGSRTRALAVGW